MTILRDAALAVTAWTVLARLFWPSLDGAVLLLEAVLERVWPLRRSLTPTKLRRLPRAYRRPA